MPVLTVIAGPNGSGKSTLIAALRDQGIVFGDYFNADDIAKDLDGPLADVAERAQQIVRQKRAGALAAGSSHSFETVMSHFSHVEYMQEARNMGFEVRLFFVATDDQRINISRVANRVEHGGHEVPENRIVSRYYRCLENLPGAIEASKFSMIFDNSQSDRPFRLLAAIQGGQILHGDVRKTRRTARPELIPGWWLEILLEIKPSDPFIDGQLI